VGRTAGHSGDQTEDRWEGQKVALTEVHWAGHSGDQTEDRWEGQKVALTEVHWAGRTEDRQEELWFLFRDHHQRGLLLR
jgi:hypothetical protein